jgi:protein-disulfide isomerase
MDKAGRLAVLLAALAVAVSVFALVQSWRQTELLRSSLRELQTEVAALRRTPILDVSGAPTLGGDDAVVTLIEFSDYECPFCVRHFQETWPQLKADYVDTGKIRYVFKDFPVDQLHPEAIRAHEAAHCAREQNRFWELHGRLFGKAGTHTPELLEQRAGEVGLDLGVFRACVESGKYTEPVRASVAQATELGATGTPAFFLGVRDPATGQVRLLQAISGAQPYSTFAKALDGLIAKTQEAK